MKITGDHIDLSDNVLLQYSKMPFTGLISLWTGDSPPTGALFCDGSFHNTADYPFLAAVLGYSGVQFQVPDLRGRFPLGADNTTTITNANATFGGDLKITSIGHEHSVDLGAIYNNSVTWSNPEIGNGSESYQFKVVNTSIAIPANTTQKQINFLPMYTAVNYIIHH